MAAPKEALEHEKPLDETIKDTLAWFQALPEARRSKPREGLTAEREKEILEAWHAKMKK